MRYRAFDCNLDIIDRKASAVEVTIKNGRKMEGLLETADQPGLDSIGLRHVRKLPRDGSARIAHMDLLGEDTVSILISDFKPIKQRSHASGFQTDTSISKSAGPAKERELQKWVPEEGDPPVTLGGTAFNTLPKGHKKGAWDQFAVNEQKFGVTTDFSEEIYTTVLDKSSPDFKKKEQEAAKMAREIEKSTTTNLHIAEERGQKAHGDHVGEEEIYSSVARPQKPAAKNKAGNEPTKSLTEASKQEYRNSLDTTKQDWKNRQMPRSVISPSVASAIRKTSINQLNQLQQMKPIPPPGTAMKNDNATPASVTTTRPNPLAEKYQLDDFKSKYVPRAEHVKTHLHERSDSIRREGRLGTLADFRTFAKEFQAAALVSDKEGKQKPVEAVVASKAQPQPIPVVKEVPAPAKTQSKTNSKESKARPVNVSEPQPVAPSAVPEVESTTPKVNFKLSASAVEFTPGGSLPKPFVKGGGNRNQNYYNGHANQYQDGGYYPPPNEPYYYNQPQYYRPMMPPPQGYMPMPGQGQFGPGGYPPMYQGQMMPPLGPNGTPMMPYMMVQGPNGPQPWFPNGPPGDGHHGDSGSNHDGRENVEQGQDSGNDDSSRKGE